MKFISVKTFLLGALALAAGANSVFAGIEAESYDGKSKGGGGATIRDTPFRAAVTLRGGYDDNINASSIDKQDSFFTNVYGELNADFGSPRTQFTIGIAGGATYYFDDEQYDYTATISAQVTHRATSRLTLSARVYGTYQVEPDYSLLLGNERRSGQYFFGNSQFSATYQWSPRFSTVTSYSLVGIFYDDERSSDSEDRTEQYFSQEFRYLARPTTTLVGEYRFGYYNYDTNNDNDGTSNYFLIGVDQAFSPRLNLSFRGGAEIRDTDVRGTQVSPYGEGTLTYAYGRFSNISWINRYGFEQSASLDGTERKTFRSGLRIKHGITARLNANFAAFYHHNEYSGSTNYAEDLIDLTTGLDFAVNRNLSLNAGYSFTHLSSDVAFRDYDRNRYNIGATISF